MCEDSSDQVCVVVKERLAVCSEQFKKKGAFVADKSKKREQNQQQTQREARRIKLDILYARPLRGASPRPRKRYFAMDFLPFCSVCSMFSVARLKLKRN